MNEFYHWFYKRYWWLLLVFFAVFFCLPLAAGRLQEPATVIVVMAGFIAVFYFIQKQRLADQRLTTRLLIHYQQGLAELDAGIQAIHSEGDTEEILPEQRDHLRAYLELCGQIYFQYAGNRIPPEVWQSWLNRMRIYYYNPRIRRVWDAELNKQAYYGFDQHILK